jgi:hypothetical protein
MDLAGDPLVFALTAAGSVIALWLLLRFPGFGPRGLSAAMLHVLAALVCGQLVSPWMQFLSTLPAPQAPLVALLGGALPPLVYFLVSLAWLVRAIQRIVSVSP